MLPLWHSRISNALSPGAGLAHMLGVSLPKKFGIGATHVVRVEGNGVAELQVSRLLLAQLADAVSQNPGRRHQRIPERGSFRPLCLARNQSRIQGDPAHWIHTA